jgi:hypothetical protein
MRYTFFFVFFFQLVFVLIFYFHILRVDVLSAIACQVCFSEEQRDNLLSEMKTCRSLAIKCCADKKYTCSYYN